MSRTPSQTRRSTGKVLSQYARNVLASLAEEPKAAEDVNPGLSHTLQERGLVEVHEKPVTKRSKRRVPYLRVTPLGHAELARYFV
jgi:hypothetical protein